MGMSRLHVCFYASTTTAAAAVVVVVVVVVSIMLLLLLLLPFLVLFWLSMSMAPAYENHAFYMNVLVLLLLNIIVFAWSVIL